MFDIEDFDLEYIASAGQGTVYKAVATEDYFGEKVEHQYAVKVFYHQNSAAVERRNMEYITDFQHVIAPRGSGVLEGEIFIAYELADMSLDDLIYKKQFWTEREVTLIVGQIICGIAEIHRQGLFHLDIKPDNVLMVDNKAKVSDLGLAIKHDGPTPYVQLNCLIGTKGFIAPESEVDFTYSQASDWYALGKLMLCFVEKAQGKYVFKSRLDTQFPVSDLYKDFVNQLLRPLTKRLGEIQGQLELHDHPLLSNISYEMIKNFSVSYY